jgi:osmotically inducible protein OsmC
VSGTLRRTAEAVWQGGLDDGGGSVRRVTSEQEPETISWGSRVGSAQDRTSPEELIAAAHAGCFSMSLAQVLEGRGTPAHDIAVQATVELALGEAPRIAAVELDVRVDVPGLDDERLQAAIQRAEADCPVSNALRGGVAIRVRAQLAGDQRAVNDDGH